jgi:hypothetical protein
MFPNTIRPTAPTEPQSPQHQPNGLLAVRRPRAMQAVVAFFLIALVGLTLMPERADAASRRRVRRAGPDFNMVISPDAVAVSPGQRAIYPVFIQAVRGFRSTPVFDIDNVPSLIDAEIVKVGTNRYQLELIVPTRAPASNGVYTLIARSGSRKRTALFRLTVNASPATQPPATQPPVTQPPVTQPPVTQPPVTSPTPVQFNLRADVTERIANSGETAQFGLSVDRSSGYTGPVTFTNSPLPTGMTANFAPNPTTASTNLYLTPGSATPTGRYVISITASAGTTQRVAAVAITVNARGDFALIGTPLTATLNGAGTANFRIDIGSGSSKPLVDFSVSGLPVGATARFSTSAAKTSTTLSVTTTANTPAGTYSVIVSGQSGLFIRQFALQLIVNRPTSPTVATTATTTTTTTAAPSANLFTLRVSSPRIQVFRANRNSFQIEVVPSAGFRNGVNIVADALPAGVRLSSTSGGNFTTVVFDADASARVGEYPLKFTGLSGVFRTSVDVVLVIV